MIFDGTQENIYDAIGRRLSSGATAYFYFDEEEIGSFEDGKIKELKVLGINSPIAIEIANKPYAATIDVQNTIRQLVDFKSGELFAKNDSDSFGCNINQNIPYAYMGKRYDSSTGFVYFGKRFYNPMSHKWITTDPLGPVDHSNLYQYVFNNPYRYYDPNGEFAFAIPLLFWGAELALPAISACITAITYTAATGAVVYGGYKLIERINESGYSEVVFDSLYKSGSIDPSLPANPDDLLKMPDWEETTHPEAGKRGHRTFENKKTGEKLRHDKGKPEESGHEKFNHYHRPNPNATNKHDEYLDNSYNPVSRHSDASHLYAPENVWWDK